MTLATWSWLQDNTAVIIVRRDKMSRMCGKTAKNFQNRFFSPKRGHRSAHLRTNKILFIYNCIIFFSIINKKHRH